MSSILQPRRVAWVAALTLAWCALWADLSLPNILAGFMVAMIVLATQTGTPGRGGVRPLALAKLLWVILVDLVSSTVGVAVEILTPTDRTDEAIIAVKLPRESCDHFMLLIVAITLTPGTAVVDADQGEAILYLHLLHNSRREETVAHVHTLSRLACEALPITINGERTC